VASLAEAITWIERSGLDRETAIGFLNDGAPGSPLFRTICDRMTREDYAVNFSLELMTKDLGYATVAAAAANVPLLTAAAAKALFQRALDVGYRKEDMAAVIEILRQKESTDSLDIQRP
jgi:3-hydroxyisobutyrate dehydrogenase